MAITYEPVNPSLIENTIMQKRLSDGVHRTYTIKAVDGYVLHDNANDWQGVDENGMPLFDENGEPVMVLGYSIGTVTCAANYDFVANPRDFYAVPVDSVPADQIFGGIDNNHEVM